MCVAELDGRERRERGPVDLEFVDEIERRCSVCGPLKKKKKEILYNDYATIISNVPRRGRDAMGLVHASCALFYISTHITADYTTRCLTEMN